MDNGVTCATRQGARRYQEDRYVVVPFDGTGFNAILLGVFDGHSGATVAEYCEADLWKRTWPSELGDPEMLLRDVIADLVEKTRSYTMGTTLSLALVVEREGMLPAVSIAVLGDSPVIVVDRAGRIDVSPEHNVGSNPEERQAIIARGGFVRHGYAYYNRNSYGLQMGRALGDRAFDGILSREPDVYTISDPAWILVASDGVFDQEHSGYVPVEELEALAKAGATAEQVLDWAEEFELLDNATAVVWKS
ncbi:MAG: protein serine/threonine phosphatase 2C family protein [Candidatus Moranbacteria bacterium]|jgi:serine/threonine protein phosphatase PrpC|nr:protein serine/threonine phosphatase 2C family protein [Candidatus Moranbacteria bacterium]